MKKELKKYSRILMPILLILIIGIAIFSLTLSYETEDGTVRTGLHGLAIYLIPNVEGLTVKRFLEILLDAMSQLFFSLSVSMGIMITYGSYVKDDVNLSKSINQIEIFDTGVAFLSGLMIIPAVFVFLGTDGMTSGPSLTFLSLPKVFASMGAAGRFVGIAFFLMLGFAALNFMCLCYGNTSCKLHGAVSQIKEENVRHHRHLFSRHRSYYLPWLQHVLF